MDTIKSVDTEIFELIEKESKRQESGLELIASENYCSKAVMEAQGSCLTNKYAEGYPNKRYYGGCEFIDEVEELAIERVKELFGIKFANVQPHSGSAANMAVYMATLSPGDTVLGMSLSEGGHLTHGSPVNFSGKLYNFISYGLDPKTELLDYEAMRTLAKKHCPKMIIAGASSYPRIIDFKKIRTVCDEVGALMLVDMAHIAGLIAAGLHPSPVGLADFITSTTHKTLRGPRGGIILTNSSEWSKKINSSIFPGIQGGPLEHVIAAKAVAFKEALSVDFKNYQSEVIEAAKLLAQSLSDEGVELVSTGTDNHLVLIKTDSFNISGKEAQALLESVNITTNKNMIPNDTRSPFITSGIRLGTAAIVSRGIKGADILKVSKWITRTLKNPADRKLHETIKQEVIAFSSKFPTFPS